MKSLFFIVGFLLLRYICPAQTITFTEQGQPCSIRGLCVVNDTVAWASGSKGHVATSTDGGLTWHWQQVKGFEQADFRDVEAFSAREAIIMSSGTPALVLKTQDGGQNWKEVYRNNNAAYFLDAMAFSADGQQGYILGDPINGQFLILKTRDGGSTWQPVTDAPKAMPGEAAFAASGTCLQLTGPASAPAFVTGGTVSRLVYHDAKAKGWQAMPLPLAQGKASQGAFSFAYNDDRILFTGGDYARPAKPDSVTCLLPKAAFNKHRLASLSKQQPAGYQSCIIEFAPGRYLTTGTPGSNLSNDKGETWQLVDSTSFNVCQKAKHGKLVLLAGDKGKIAILKNH